MRLWHQNLLPYLDKQRLLGQHRECCALRGCGWGRKHSTVDYVFKYGLDHLYEYHCIVLRYLIQNYNVSIDAIWYNRTYRGKQLKYAALSNIGCYVYPNDNSCIYPEHDDKYLHECLLNLKAKNAELVNGKTIEEMLIGLDLKDIK